MKKTTILVSLIITLVQLLSCKKDLEIIKTDNLKNLDLKVTVDYEISDLVVTTAGGVSSDLYFSNITYNVKNNSTYTGKAKLDFKSFKVKYYLSPTETFDANTAVELKEYYSGSSTTGYESYDYFDLELNESESFTWSDNYHLYPQTTSSAYQYFLARIIPESGVIETNSNNNVAAYPISLYSGPQYGTVTFFYNNSYLDKGYVSVYINGGSYGGTITQAYYSSSVYCDASGCANFYLPVGDYTWYASTSGWTWPAGGNGTFSITAGGCVLKGLNP